MPGIRAKGRGKRSNGVRPIPPCSPAGCILKNWNKFGGDSMTKEQMKRYCNQWWPNYKLEDGEWWPENGSLQFTTILQQTLFCCQLGKWDEVSYVYAFVRLYRRPGTHRRCKLWGGTTTVPCLEEKGTKRRVVCCGGDEQEGVQSLAPSSPLYKGIDQESQKAGKDTGQVRHENFSPISSRT